MCITRTLIGFENIAVSPTFIKLAYALNIKFVMLRSLIIILLAMIPVMGLSQTVWINEIHYDNTGSDVNQGFEIAGTAGLNLACYDLIHVNGSGGANISTTNLAGTIPDEGCGFGAVWFPIGLQNGPDGLALYNTCTGSLIQFLSYEGTTITATSAPILGAISTNIGVTEGSGTPTTSSLQLNGSGNNYGAFVWSTPAASTHGSLNTGQTISPCGGNTITTGLVSAPPFIVACTVSTAAAGTVAFTSTGTFNGPNIYTAQLSDATGSFTAPTVIGTLASTANTGTIPITIPATTATGAGYLIRVISDDPLTNGSSSAAFTITQSSPCQSTSITIEAVTTSPFVISCTAPTTADGNVAFVSTGTFSGANVYSAELSDASGSFASPTVVGTLASTANNGEIAITIPSGLSTGTGYLIRITSSDPVFTGTNSIAFKIIQSSPCLPTLPSSSGLIINEWSNGPSWNKEYYEFVVAGQCGELVDIRGFILDDNNGTFTAPASYSGTSSGIAPGHFRFSFAAQWAAIPVGSLIVIYNGEEPNAALPADDPTDSNVDSLYVIPHNSPLFERCTSFPTAASPDSVYAPCTYAPAPIYGWNPLSLRNSGDAIQVRAPDGSYYHGVSYGGSEMTGGPNNLKQFTGSGTDMVGWFSDGDFYDISNWNYGTTGSNQTPGLPNNALNSAWLSLMRDTTSATCPVIPLPVEISSFEGKRVEVGNLLYWQTDSEMNSSFFTLEHSLDTKTWDVINTQPAAMNSTSTQHYSFIDTGFGRTVNYYRLSETDTDGTVTSYPKYVALYNGVETQELVKIINILGQEIDDYTHGVQIHVYSDGTIKRVFKN